MGSYESDFPMPPNRLRNSTNWEFARLRGPMPLWFRRRRHGPCSWPVRRNSAFGMPTRHSNRLLPTRRPGRILPQRATILVTRYVGCTRPVRYANPQNQLVRCRLTSTTRGSKAGQSEIPRDSRVGGVLVQCSTSPLRRCFEICPPHPEKKRCERPKPDQRPISNKPVLGIR